MPSSKLYPRQICLEVFRSSSNTSSPNNALPEWIKSPISEERNEQSKQKSYTKSIFSKFLPWKTAEESAVGPTTSIENNLNIPNEKGIPWNPTFTVVSILTILKNGNKIK